MDLIGKIPKELIDYAQRYHRRIPGDWPSIATAQWALETGWGEAEGLGGDIWRDGWNAGAIKAASDPRYQTAPPKEGHARYAHPEDYWRDRARILSWYAARARATSGLIPWDILGLLDEWWAPGQAYGQKLRAIIHQHKLWRLDPRPSL